MGGEHWMSSNLEVLRVVAFACTPPICLFFWQILNIIPKGEGNMQGFISVKAIRSRSDTMTGSNLFKELTFFASRFQRRLFLSHKKIPKNQGKLLAIGEGHELWGDGIRLGPGSPRPLLVLSGAGAKVSHTLVRFTRGNVSGVM